MIKDIQTIKDAALALDVKERVDLVDELVYSISGRSERFDQSLDSAYEEAKRRSDAYDRGELETVDGKEAVARVRKMIGQ
jgi:hypothetical protein